VVTQPDFIRSVTGYHVHYRPILHQVK